MPGVCCGRHWWDGEGRCPAVGLDELALVRDGRRDVGAQRCLEGRDVVELHSGQAARKAGRVVLLDEHRVDLASLCRRREEREIEKRDGERE